MKWTSTRRAAAVLGTAVLAAGCGGSSHPASTRTPTTTTPQSAQQPGGASDKAAYVAAADASCLQFRASLVQFDARTRAISALGDTTKAFAQAAPLVGRVAALDQAELDRLRALKLPSGNTSQVTGFFQATATAITLVTRLSAAFRRGDRATIMSLEQQGSRVAATAKGLAQGYGFKVCGNGTGGTGLT